MLSKILSKKGLPIHDEKLRSITSISQSVISESIIDNPNEIALKSLSLSKRQDIPNLLSRKYKVDFKTEQNQKSE